MNEEIRFDERRSDAWRAAIVQHAETDARRIPRKRFALIAGLVIAAVAVSGGGVAYALSTTLLRPPAAPIAQTATPDVRDTDTPVVTPPPTPPETPTPPPSPTPSPTTADYTVLGFDAAQLYDTCQAAVRAQYPDIEQSYPGITQFEPLGPETLVDAQEDGAGHVAIRARSLPSTDGATMVWICEFKGDPANPELAYASFADK